VTAYNFATLNELAPRGDQTVIDEFNTHVIQQLV
jgi:hypothetical protein